MPSVFAEFDGGNIRCLDASRADDIRLEIKPDGKAKFFQWFYFQLCGEAGRSYRMTITNADGASYLGGWKGYRAVASYDGESWFRVDTSFDGKSLIIEHAPEHNNVYYAYFAPYSTARVQQFVDEVSLLPLVTTTSFGATLDGQNLTHLKVGEGALNLWVIARQHPGETMGSWWMEGFLRKLIDENDADAKLLREKATVHVAPCMNLDGARRGHLRTNAAGTDLNRAWRNTTMEKSPEVFLVREKMRETGVDFFLDVHGDEAIPNNFLDGAEGIPGWNEIHADRLNAFSDSLLEISTDFQTAQGYPTPAAGGANLDIATNYVAETWDCLAMTLEMPFKDANVNPEPIQGWSPSRCQQLGRDCLSVLVRNIDRLR